MSCIDVGRAGDRGGCLEEDTAPGSFLAVSVPTPELAKPRQISFHRTRRPHFKIFVSMEICPSFSVFNTTDASDKTTIHLPIPFANSVQPSQVRFKSTQCFPTIRAPPRSVHSHFSKANAHIIMAVVNLVKRR
jgi:hypothetical protein